MNKEEKIDFLINELVMEEAQHKNIEIRSSITGKRKLLRALMNVRPPKPISKKFIEIQDELLLDETKEKGIIKLSDIETIPNSEKISLWQGDITTLEVDGIVNAANSQMLGCFVPGHECIDNIIHSAAGIQLREECNKIMQKQGFPELIGSAKITDSYNLPCKYVLHTVGPRITSQLTDEHCKQLADCYKACLNLAVEKNLKSIAFCCISTGEFRFPKKKAAEIAIESVFNFLSTENKLERIIFDVFTCEDNIIYKKILENI